MTPIGSRRAGRAHRVRRCLLVAVAAVALAACSAGSPGDRTPRPSLTVKPSVVTGGQTPPVNVHGDVVVFAAASLTGAFTELKKDFEATYPGVTVKLSFGASSTLAQNLIQGAPADVFASAAVVNMKQAQKAKAAKASTIFARNVMQIAVSPKTKAHITSLADLAKPGVTVELCEKQVPCGAVAQEALKNAGVNLTPKTYGADVKAVLTSVQLGEVDAGIVYVTDVEAAGGKVRGVTIPPAQNASTDYPIALTTDAPNPAAGQAFIDEVLSAQGQQVLARAGFEKP